MSVMGSSNTVCGECERQHISNSSVVWCSECEEGLCADCEKSHCLIKATKNHKTTPLAAYQILKSLTANVKEICDEHKEKYQTYCNTHEKPCCRKCKLSTHKECIENIVPIENIKTSSSFEEIEESLDDMTKNISMITENCRNNIRTLSTTRENIEGEIQEIRRKVNKHLDILQDKLFMDLEKVEKDTRNQINQLITSLDEKQIEINNCIKNVAIIKKYASHLQAFFGLKQIQSEVAKNEIFLWSISDDGSLYQKDISCKIEAALTNLQSFGEIGTTTKASELKLVWKKDKPPRCIENITLTFQQKFDDLGHDITGCSMLPDGKMVFTDFGAAKFEIFNPKPAALIVLNTDGSTHNTIMIGRKGADDVTSVNDFKVAVTSKHDQCITLIDLKNRAPIQRIHTGVRNVGITCKDGALIYCAIGRGIQRMEPEHTQITTDVVNFKAGGWSYVASFGDKLFYTGGEKTDVVCCCDMEGTPIWEFENSILKGPRGICVDEYQNVFVAGGKSANVIVLSPDGKEANQLLSSKDSLSDPRGIHYDRSTNRLLVIKDAHSAAWYSLEAR